MPPHAAGWAPRRNSAPGARGRREGSARRRGGPRLGRASLGVPDSRPGDAEGELMELAVTRFVKAGHLGAYPY